MDTIFSGFGIFDFHPLLPGVHGGSHDGGGLVGLVEELLEGVSRPSPAPWSLLGGIEALGKNLHPMILHFPIAFLIGYFLLELFGVLLRKQGARQLASGLLYLGAFSSVVTVVSGLLAAELVPHGAAVHEIMQWHQRAGIVVAVLSAALALSRRFGGIPSSAMGLTLNGLLSVIMTIVLILGADMGGMMVYGHGVGVKSLQTEAEHQHHIHNGSPVPKSTPETH